MDHRIYKGEGRMFKSDFMESLSTVHPATPFVFYMPVVVYGIYKSAVETEFSGLIIFLCFLLSYIFWTLSEYWLHRTLFHWVPKSPMGQKFHHHIHGIHHQYPWDTRRMVMPLLGSVAIYSCFHFGFTAIFGEVYRWLCIPGFLFGYIIYDTVHWYTHVGKPKNKILKYLKKEHLVHHFREGEGETRFGVSCPYWDYVFGTSGDRKIKDENILNKTVISQS